MRSFTCTDLPGASCRMGLCFVHRGVSSTLDSAWHLVTPHYLLTPLNEQESLSAASSGCWENQGRKMHSSDGQLLCQWPQESEHIFCLQTGFRVFTTWLIEQQFSNLSW